MGRRRSLDLGRRVAEWRRTGPGDLHQRSVHLRRSELAARRRRSRAAGRRAEGRGLPPDQDPRRFLARGLSAPLRGRAPGRHEGHRACAAQPRRRAHVRRAHGCRGPQRGVHLRLLLLRRARPVSRGSRNAAPFLARAEKRIPELAAATAKAGTWVVPNLVAYTRSSSRGRISAAVLRRPETKYLPPGLAAEWQPGRNRYDRKYSPGDGRAHDLAAGTALEAHGRFSPGGRADDGRHRRADSGRPARLLIARRIDAAGCRRADPFEALRAATADPAEFLGRAGEFGTVAVGRRADLVLLDADPLRDVANVARRAGVMVRGRWLTQDELNVMLAN